MYGGSGDDEMAGGYGADEMHGDSGDDYLFGDNGNDFIEGGDGDDTLLGSGGDDTLRGGDGDDLLRGGTDFGSDNGQDLFVFDGSDGHDTIADFHPGEDTFAFEGIHNANQLGVTVHGGNTIITYGDTTVTVQGVEMTAAEVWANTQHH